MQLTFVFQIAKSSLENSMLKYSVKEYYFRAALCYLCIDILDAERAIERYVELYPALNDSRECRLLRVTWKLVTERARSSS